MGLGLPTGLAAAIHGLLSVGLAWVLLRGLADTAIRNNLLVFAACTSIFVHMLPSPVLLLLGFTVAIFLAQPKQQNHVPALYFGYLLLFPDYISYDIPFPGLNYLINYAWWFPLAVLYLPRAPRRRDIQWNSVDVFFALFLLLIAVLDFRENTITNGLRDALMTFTYLFVPYWLLRRAFRSHDDLAAFIRGIFVTAVILGCFAFVSQLARWDFMAPPGWVEYRMGLLRIGVTLATGLMGLVCGLGLVLIVYRNRKLGLRPLWTFVIIFVLAVAVLSSGARVALLSTALVGLLLVFYSSLTPRRLIGATAILFLTSGVIVERLVTMDMGVLDEHGTFAYRQQILAATIATVGESPLWGNIHFLESRYLQPLYQGSGIIDIVNRYAQIALQYGLIALIFFVLAHGIAIFKAVQYWSSTAISGGGGHVASPDIKFVVACSIAYMFFIGTTSDTSHVALYGVIFLAILRACTSMGQQKERRTRKSSPAAPLS
jgi:O-antigen ligase